MRCRGLEFRMYNERTQSPELSRSGVIRPQRCRRDASTRDNRDIPFLELAENDRPRRRCDGSLRQERGESAEMPQGGCGCTGCGGWGIEGNPLAMVYSPCQAWRDAYTPDVALTRGTLFSELDLPFEPRNSKRGCM